MQHYCVADMHSRFLKMPNRPIRVCLTRRAHAGDPFFIIDGLQGFKELNDFHKCLELKALSPPVWLEIIKTKRPMRHIGH
ncbi:hypothetical protein ACUY4Q_002174 [Phytobacter sp. AG2a]